MNPNYYRVCVSNWPRSFEESLTELCFLHGSEGTSEILGYEQSSKNYQPTTVYKDKFDLEIYFNEEPQNNFIECVQDIYKSADIQIFLEPQKDWMEEWKKDFKPFLLCKDTWVIPSWCRSPEEAVNRIFIDPGMAFGTGTHATTKLLAKNICENIDLKGKKVLDVGTGSGILAILAAKFQAEKVYGIDIDPDACQVAVENLRKNNVESIVEITDQPLSLYDDSFDVVMANIIDGVLLELKNELFRSLKVGGYLLLSGILAERKSIFIEQFVEPLNLQVISQNKLDEWISLLCKKV